MSEHQDAANAAIRRRIQDAIDKAHKLLLDHAETQAHIAELTDELWTRRSAPINIADLTDEERISATNAARMALHIIDEGEDG